LTPPPLLLFHRACSILKLLDIQKKISLTAAKEKRRPEDITLIAVSKTRTLDDIKKLCDAGHIHFGENRVQEAAEKFPTLKNLYPHIQLHFIGHLQSNKADEAVALFDMIHTVDRASIAEALKKEMDKQKKQLPCFIQVNTGEEAQKGGVHPHGLDALYLQCTKNLRLDITGLMSIPPEADLPDLHFALLHKIARTYGLKHLSMGMSGDFEPAIRYGATHLRLGSALF
jgi:PLP dependent protein